MLRFLLLIPMVVCASLAQAADVGTTLATWKTLRDPNIPVVSFSMGRSFLTEHPGWPEEKAIRLRTEAAALAEYPAREVMSSYCADYPPISGRGMMACAIAGAGDATKQAEWIKQGWIQGDFNEDEEKRVLKAFGEKFTKDMHIARTERLLYEAKSNAAKRMLPRVPVVKHNLYNVRMAFIANDKKAPKLLGTLSAELQRDPGILFERVRWRLKRGDNDIADLLLMAPKNVPLPDLWWPLRINAARTAIGQGHYTQALALINNHGDIKPEALADALWTKGWIHLQHKNNAGDAYKEFFKLYTSVTTPVSKARAAYWAGRAAKKNGNHEIALEWMEKASKHPTVFYGQMAQLTLKPKTTLKLPKVPEPTAEERAQFEADERVAAVKLLASSGDEELRNLFLTSLGIRMKTPGQFALLARLAGEIGGLSAGVEAAKLGLRNDVVILDAGWPRIGLPNDLPIEPALTLAITRQESEFNPDARSPANARGLMQLLPSTAAHVAKKLDITYNDAMISDPATNLTLGSRYLGQIISGFDGSYIMGIASYNAGPGSVRKWIKAMGSAPKNVEGAIDWIESIPFVETRNYVMRVLENVQIYRTIEDRETPLALDKDLIR